MNHVVTSAPVGTSVDYDPFAGGALSLVVPTTEPQREIWLADQLSPQASLAFNLSVSLRLRGALDQRALRAALQALVDRHDALRATVGPDGETFCILEHHELPLEVFDLAMLERNARLERVDERLRLSVETPFAPSTAPMFRAELLRLADNDHQLVLTAHHIVCDGWSWWVLVRELGALYGQFRDGSAALPPPASFAEYALAEVSHQSAGGDADDEAYWLARMADAPPVLELPTDHARPAERSFASAREDHVFDAALLASLKRLGARRGASLFATLLAGFSGVLARLSGQHDVVIGIPAAGQPVRGQVDVVGHCVNMLPLRFAAEPAQPFTRLLDEAQATLLDALEHQRYTYGTLLRKLRIQRDPGRMPLVSVLFNLDQALDKEGQAFPGLVLEFDSNARAYDPFEIFLNAVQVQGELRLECQYNRDLFDAATIRRWLRAYETLLRAAVEREEAAIGSLPLVDAVAFAQLAALQPEPVVFDRACRMHEHFERQCDCTPDRVAVRSGATVLRYSELEARANRIAHLLRRHGVQRGALVGIALDRDADMLAGLLGVLKAGAGYVPLDPQFPQERLAYMAADAGLAALLTLSEHAAGFELGGRPVLALDRLSDELASMSPVRLGRDVGSAGPEDTAYVIYTSGSTGKPKGVQVPHRAVANFIVGMQRAPGMAGGDRLLAVTTLSFDIAVLELLLPLSVGAEVLIADRETAADGAALRALLEASRVTMMQATPSTWRMLVDSGWTGSGLTALCGGEPLAPDLAAALLARCRALWNLYGPTETTVWSTVARVSASNQGPDVHIGRPTANTRVWILDPNGELCPLGVPGEIHIGGDGVTLGYFGRPDLTADRFIPDRYADASRRPRDANLPPPLLYRTGDRGRWRDDGNLEHLGRLDHQVKVRGYRIELGEIEANLVARPEVGRAVAIVREDHPNDQRLVAYVVPADGAHVDDAALRAHLRDMLPPYMVPQHVVALERLPLLPNGKLDRKALPAPATRTETAPAPEERRELDPRVDYLAAIWTDLLGTPAGPGDNFFELGGHSMLGVQMANRVARDTGVRIKLIRLGTQTLAELAADLPPMGNASTSVGQRIAQGLRRLFGMSGAP